MVLASAAAIAFYWWLSALFAKSSDQINYLYAGMDVLRGNWRLRGWYLTSSDFYTSDIWLSALLTGLLHLVGRHDAAELILSLQPAITWTAILGLSLLLACRGMGGGQERLAAASIVLAVLGVPLLRETVVRLILYSAIHLGSVLYCLAIFHAASRIIERGGRGALIALSALVALGVFGDPIVLFVGVAPLLVLSVQQPFQWRLGAAAVAGVLAAKGLLLLNRLTGGFTVPDLPMVFAGYGDIPGNVAVALHGALQLFSADWFGRELIDAVPELLHVPLAFAAGVAVVIVLRHRAPAASPLMRLLAFGTAFDIAATVLSNLIILQGAGNEIWAARYLFPAWVFSAILLARFCAGRARLGAIALPALAVSAVMAIHDLSRPHPGLVPPRDRTLIFWLEQNAPAQGIGSYFAASMLQLASHGRLHIAPGQAFPTSRIEPVVQISQRFDFAAITAGDFFVLVPPELRNYTADDAIGTFGQPSRRAEVAGYEVLIYRK